MQQSQLVIYTHSQRQHIRIRHYINYKRKQSVRNQWLDLFEAAPLEFNPCRGKMITVKPLQHIYICMSTLTCIFAISSFIDLFFDFSCSNCAYSFSTCVEEESCTVAMLL